MLTRVGVDRVGLGDGFDGVVGDDEFHVRTWDMMRSTSLPGSAWPGGVAR